MEAFLRVDLKGNVLFVPAVMSANLMKIIAASTLCERRWKSEISDYTYEAIEKRTHHSQLDVQYTELPSSDAFDPASQWHNIRLRLAEAEAKLQKHESLIKAAEELEPKPQEDDAPF